jgi:putative membrane protein
MFTPLLFLALLLFPMVASAQYGYGMMGDGFYGAGFGMGWLGFVFMLIFWGAVIAGVVWLVRIVVKPESKFGGKDALAILKERLAKGEIDVKEFKVLKKEIDGK